MSFALLFVEAGTATGRLLSVEARVTGTGYTDQPFAQLFLTYDAQGRVSERKVQLFDNISGTWAAGAMSRQSFRYSGATGRLIIDSTIVHTNSAGANPVLRGLFQAADGNFTTVGDLNAANTAQPNSGGAHAGTYSYTSDGTRRLNAYTTWTGTIGNYTYDAFGNRITELATDPCHYGLSSATNVVAPDNRLRQRTWAGWCRTDFVSDQAGNRLAELDYDSGNTLVMTRYQRMSYTALNQLYASATNSDVDAYQDFNWHWYDADGMRVKTRVQAQASGYAMNFALATNPDQYYIYDGAELALIVVKSTGGWRIDRRFVSLGLDAAVVGRFPTISSGLRTELLVTDHQGNPTGAIRADALVEENSDVYGRDPFGRRNASAVGANGPLGVGFAGGSTPNATGGFTYFRNRWYDPNTGRFLTQDPIGLAGGVNLYAYAGNNPVGFSDPWGLSSCPKDAGGDGKTQSFDDCEAGTSGWYANRMAKGEGNQALNAIGGTLASCGESFACQATLAVASLGGSLVEGLAGKGAVAGTEAAAGGSGRVVIGETMGRVNAAAAETGAETFQTTARTARQMWRENSTWLRSAMREGKEVIDIGENALRPVRSPFYRAERNLLQLRGYPTTPMQWPGMVVP